jgi:hypothetical protein
VTTTSDVRRQIQDGALSTGAIDGDTFDSWYVSVRRDARQQMIDWLDSAEVFGHKVPTEVISEACSRFDLTLPWVSHERGSAPND